MLFAQDWVLVDQVSSHSDMVTPTLDVSVATDGTAVVVFYDLP